MTSYGPTYSAHKTLSGTTVDTVTLDGAYRVVEVLHRSGTTGLWVTVGVVGAPPVDPVSAADGTTYVPPGGSKLIALRVQAAAPVVKLLGNGDAYSVQGEG